jgi:predicted nucleic acid-binding protein
LVVAKKEGRLDEVEPAIEELRRAGLHVSDAVVDQVLRMAGES